MRAGGMMNYWEAAGKLTGRCANRRKLENNTYLERRGANIAVRLHNTDVLTFLPNGDVVVDSGGWRTVTTKDRLNAYLPGMWRVWQEKGSWLVARYGSVAGLFQDAAVLRAGGDAEGLSDYDPKAGRALKRRAKAYAEACAAAVPISRDAGPICPDCELGPSCRTTQHLTDHMETARVVSSLVYQALVAHHNAPAAFWEAFQGSGWTGRRDFGRMAVQRAVYRYILRRFGYAA